MWICNGICVYVQNIYNTMDKGYHICFAALFQNEYLSVSQSCSWRSPALHILHFSLLPTHLIQQLFKGGKTLNVQSRGPQGAGLGNTDVPTLEEYSKTNVIALILLSGSTVPA